MEAYDMAAFSILISATDPVSVISLFSIIDVDRTLNILVVGESLLNDAVTIVMKKVLDSVKIQGELDSSLIMNGVFRFIWIFIGSILLGLLSGIFISWVIKKQ